MRINRDALIGIAQDTVDGRARADSSLLAAYLHGSLLYGDPFVGNTADIDIVLIKNEKPLRAREVVRITDDIHLDIAHHEEREYKRPRMLRVHPWLGPTLFDAKILYDPHHKMDFIQAGVRGLFYSPEFTMQRARTQVVHARQIWMGFQSKPTETEVVGVTIYLKGLEHAANGIALLSGHPLTERRFLLNFHKRADAIGKPGLYADLLNLLGSPYVEADEAKSWLVDWEKAFDSISYNDRPQRLHLERKAYYLKAIDTILDSERPMDALWPLLKTWTLVISHLPKDHRATTIWNQVMQQLGLSGQGFRERLEAYDTYLDLVEEILDAWGQEHGA